jgi:hypothetical protein
MILQGEGEKNTLANNILQQNKIKERRITKKKENMIGEKTSQRTYYE